MKADIVVRLKLPEQKHLEIIQKALEPEIREPPTMRSRVFLKKNNKIVLKIEAKDTVALRASVNTYLRWISTISDCLSILAEES